MKYPFAFLKGANLKTAKIWFVVVFAFVLYLFSGLDVKAQFQPPCVDSTPICPCIIANGDCFDIDTPIDDELIVLVAGGLALALFKLHALKFK